MKFCSYHCDRCNRSGDEKVFATLHCMRFKLRDADPPSQLDLCAICFDEMLDWLGTLAKRAKGGERG